MVALATSSVSTPVCGSAAPGAVTGGAKWLLQIEGLALLAAATAAYGEQGFGGGWFALFFLAPDLTFAAYVFGPRWGALAYNAVHTTVFPAALGAAAFAFVKGAHRLACVGFRVVSRALA